MIGFEPWAYPPIRKVFFPALDDVLEHLDAAHKEATTTHTKAAQVVKEWVGMKFTPWKVEAKVWLDSRKLKINFSTCKLALWWEIPLEISQVISLYTYCLCLSPTWKIHGVFHAFLPSPYTETPEFSPNFIPQPSKLIEGEEEYEADTIRTHRGSLGQWQYLVSLKGYSCTKDTCLIMALPILFYEDTNFPDQRTFLWLPPSSRHLHPHPPPLHVPATAHFPTGSSPACLCHPVHVYSLCNAIRPPLIQPHKVCPAFPPIVNLVWLISHHLECLSH